MGKRMAQAMKTKKGMQEKPFELMPQHLDWFMENGLDLRLFLSSANGHYAKAQKISRALQNRNLKKLEGEMDRYLFSCRSASSMNWRIANGLLEKKEQFLRKNPRVSKSGYDRLVESIEARAKKCERISTRYEKLYEKRYGSKRKQYESILKSASENKEAIRSAIYASLEKLGIEPKGADTSAYTVARKSHAIEKPPSRRLPGQKESPGQHRIAEREKEIRKLAKKRDALAKEAEKGIRNVAQELRRLNREIARLRKQREG